MTSYILLLLSSSCECQNEGHPISRQLFCSVLAKFVLRVLFLSFELPVISSSDSVTPIS